MKKILLFFYIFTLFFTAKNTFAVSGRLTDKKGNPVSSAVIKFTDTKNPLKVYQTLSDTNGFYSLDIPTLNLEAGLQYSFFNIYPNPFYNGTVIPFYLNKSGNCYVYIYNSMGQRVRTMVEGLTSAGMHQMVWDATTDKNQRVSPGFYIVYMYFEGRTSAQKIIMRSSHEDAVFPDGIPAMHQMDSTKIISYNINITSASTLPYSVKNFTITNVNSTNFILHKRLALPFKVSGKYLSVNKGDNTYDTIFVNGINLGVGLPGTYPGEMAATSEDYRRWFSQMGDIGFNAIRTYTLHYPRFYDELSKYNDAHPDKPLYLLQGVWLDEEQPQGNFFSFSQNFDADIREVIDCMHGNKEIAERPGRASGVFTTNISPWVLSYIIGREIHPYEVEKTNQSNWNYTSYNGYTMSMPDSTKPHQPIECWLAQRMDKLIIYERQVYQVERPVSVSSWPTLDPIYHPSEHLNPSPDYKSEEDKDSLDFNRLTLHDAPAGFFLTYHAYPYYPDFITDDPGYLKYEDQFGPNSYENYLLELWATYSKYPVLIGEYGVPSSWGNAHYANSGMNHGGHNYDSQGFSDYRLLNSIHNSFLAGGCLFAWIDEWFKQTWITNRITCPPNRRLYWHNLASPEENFGLITFVPDTVKFEKYQGLIIGNDITDVKVAHDFQYFYLTVNLKDSIKANEDLWIALDTYKDTLGEYIMPKGQTLNHLSEFAIKLSKDSANLYVTRAYNTEGIYFYWWKDTLTDQRYQSTKSFGGKWDLVRWKNGYKADALQYLGYLNACDSLQDTNSMNAVIRNKYSYQIRLPWQLINFTDPSQVMVLHDDRNTAEVESEYSDGIATTIFFKNTVFESNRYYWDWWGYVNPSSGEFVFPKYKEVPKKSFTVFKDLIKTLNLKPLPQ